MEYTSAKIITGSSRMEGCGMYSETSATWAWGPFCKAGEANPCLTPQPGSVFHCPMRQAPVHWEEKDVFNPAAVVREDKVYLLYRAEDTVGTHAGTSRIGLAVSGDGLHFETMPEPVLYPAPDGREDEEWDGGCEDPRVCEREDGLYVMLYTAYNGRLARLCAASSRDLLTWEKHGPVFRQAHDGRFANLYCKSGSVVCAFEGDRCVAQKIDGRYWMYWGEGHIYAAVSDDLLVWEPVEFRPDGAAETALYPVMGPRRGRYDEMLCEPGPPAILTDDGILLLYNGKGANPRRLGGHDTMYQPGQALLDRDNPTQVLARTSQPFLSPSEPFELAGQVMPTCFIEGLVRFKGQYFLYYGTADSRVAVACCPV